MGAGNGVFRDSLAYWAALGNFMREGVTAGFVRFMAARYPAAHADPALWSLLGYLALGTYYHRDRDRLQLPYQLLASLAGRLTPRVLARRTFPDGERLLRRLQALLGEDERGTRFTWTAAWTGHQPRLVRRLAWPSDVARAIEEERATPRDERRVYWHRTTARGRPAAFRVHEHGARRSAEIEALAQALRPETHPIPAVLSVLDELNATPPNVLTRLVAESYPAALVTLDRIRDDALAAAEEERGDLREEMRCGVAEMFEQQVRLLSSIGEAPLLRYFVPPNTPRLFAIGGGVTNLKAAVRRALLPGLVELDLDAAHVAALAELLGLPALRTFLEEEVDLWAALVRDLELEALVGEDESLYNKVKGVLKAEGLYPAGYGRTRDRVVRQVRTELRLRVGRRAEACADVGQRFVTHPRIAELLEATAAKLAQIEVEGSLLDLQGRRIALPGHRGDVVLVGDGEATQRDLARTALAYAATACEVELMSAVTDLQREQDHRRFCIQIWQHDGVSVRVVDRRRVQRVVAEIRDAVERRAAQLGVWARLRVVEETLP